jgi:hypothetical protein
MLASTVLGQSGIVLAADSDVVDEVIEIKSSEGLDNVGKRVRVKLTVQSIGRGAEMYNLNSEKSWKAPGNLQVRLSQEIFNDYVKQGIEQPQRHFFLKHVEVTGVIREVRPGGIPVAAIDLESVDDLKHVLRVSREAPAVEDLGDRRIDLYLKNGQQYGDVIVAEVIPGKVPNSLVSIDVRIGDKPGARRFRAAGIEEIVVEGLPLDLAYDRRLRATVVDQKKREARLKVEEANEQRVLALGKHIWPYVTDQEHTDWIAQHRQFLASVQGHFQDLPLQLVESKYFLILTDIPDAEARKYLAYLDALYDEMSLVFGVPQGSNIWCGKCIVVAFQNRADFVRFEIEIMKNSGDPQKSGGSCHSADSGRVVVSLYKESLTDRFAALLAIETAHGFVWRFRSNVRVPSWVDQGMSLSLADQIVKGDKSLENAQRKSITAIRQQRTLGGVFDAFQIEDDAFGSAAAMVSLLVRRDGRKFRQFFIDLKMGVPQEEALQNAYGLSFGDLAQLYGRGIGVPDLKP